MAGRWKIASATAGLPFEIGIRHVILGAELDARDVLQPDEAALGRGLNDDLPELARILEAALSRDRELERGIRRCRLLPQGAAGNLDVLLLDRLDHFARRHAEGCELLGIEPDAQGILPLAEDDEIAHAVEAQEDVAHVVAGIVRDVELIVGAVRREHVHDHHQVGRALERRHPEASHLFRQARRGDRDPVLDQHLSIVEIGAELERDRQRHGAVARGIGRHVEHVLDAVDLLLQRRRDGGGDRLRIRSRIARPNHDGRRCDVGILRDRQSGIGDAADDQEERRQDRCEDRPIDEEVGEAHGDLLAWDQLPLRSRVGGRVVICGVIGIPGRTRTSPFTTTVSLPVSPSRMTR